MIDDISINFAKRLVEYHKLVPPVDVFHVASQVAEVINEVLPVQADGACIKGLGQPIILINKAQKIGRTKHRIRFTVAHEIGHAINPNHTGTYLDESVEFYFGDPAETEANQFASELLMPTVWMENRVADLTDPALMQQQISREADVSLDAAMFRLISFLPKGWLVAKCSPKDNVLYSVRSVDTLTVPLLKDSAVDIHNIFPHACKTFKQEYGHANFYWWQFPQTEEIRLPSVVADWRVLLRQMVAEIENTGKTHSNPIQSVAGIIGSIGPNQLSHEELLSAMRQKFNNRARDDDFYKAFVAHPRFDDFLLNRIAGGFGKKSP